MSFFLHGARRTLLTRWLVFSFLVWGNLNDSRSKWLRCKMKEEPSNIQGYHQPDLRSFFHNTRIQGAYWADRL